LPGRVATTLDRAEQRSKAGTQLPSIDPRFLALIIHDLRTPLNVIGLTIRAIMQTVPQRSAELDEDLMFLRENASQIEKMLAQLGDYCRLIEGELQVSTVAFDPRRFLSDFLEVHRSKSSAEASPVRLELAESCPAEVALDPNRVQLALQHSLANAVNAAASTPVRLRSSGGPDRWVIELIVDKPPPLTVGSMPLRPDHFERLAGSAAERRGLDLAIAARVSELFGGSARLVAEPDRRTAVVLDWPSRLVGL
jgi:signal transduction histidine kinase